MRTIYLTKDNFNTLRKLHKEIIIESTTSTTAYRIPETGERYMYCPSTLKKDELRVISKTRSDVMNHMKEHGKPNVSRHNLREIVGESTGVRMETGPIWFDAFEYDIKAAYWNTAFQLGFIKEDTYEIGIKHKLARNMSLGALAKNTDYYLYRDGKSEFIESKRNETASYFYAISNYVSSKIEKLKGKYLFMWVDAVFFPYRKSIEELETILNPFEVREIPCTIYYNSRVNAYIVRAERKGKVSSKPYFMTKNKQFYDTI